MKTYIALFRRINVSGQKKIKMTELKILLEILGFTNVQTHIQSENVIFSSTSTVIIKLENKLKASATTGN